jgi:hypothetical protein
MIEWHYSWHYSHKGAFCAPACAHVLQAPCMAYVDDWVVLSEEEIRAAMVDMLDKQGKLVEGERL